MSTRHNHNKRDEHINTSTKHPNRNTSKPNTHNPSTIKFGTCGTTSKTACTLRGRWAVKTPRHLRSPANCHHARGHAPSASQCCPNSAMLLTFFGVAGGGMSTSAEVDDGDDTTGGCSAGLPGARLGFLPGLSTATTLSGGPRCRVSASADTESAGSCFTVTALSSTSVRCPLTPARRFGDMAASEVRKGLSVNLC
jgi:hypothetical protein